MLTDEFAFKIISAEAFLYTAMHHIMFRLTDWIDMMMTPQDGPTPSV